MARADFPREAIERYDKFDVLKQINALPDGLLQGYKLSDSVNMDKRPEKVVLCGAGRSAQPAGVLKTFLEESGMSIIIHKDYGLPSEVGSDDLVICISYDGEDDEAASSLKAAAYKKCQTVSLSRGGRLYEMSKDNRLQHIKLPGGFRSGFVFGHVLGALIGVIQEAEFIRGAGKVLSNTANSLRKLSFDSPSIAMAGKIEEPTPLVYAGQSYLPVAERWKSQVNSMAGSPAFCSSINEMAHSEIEALEQMSDDYFMIILSSSDYSTRIKKKIRFIKDISSKVGLNMVELAVKGDSKLTKLLSGVMMGDLTAYYLALKKRRNPALSDNIDNIKERIGPYV